MVSLLALAICAAPPYQLAFCRAGDVWTVWPDGTHEKKIASTYRIGGKAYDRPIVSSPDGSTLIYWDHAAGHWDLIAVDGAGGNRRNLTPDLNGGCRSAAFSPDGKHIAFMCDEPWGLHVMRSDGGGKRHLIRAGDRDRQPEWSADGKYLAWADDAPNRLLIMLVSGGAPVFSGPGSLVGWDAGTGVLWMTGTRGTQTWSPQKGLTNVGALDEYREGFSPKGEWLLKSDVNDRFTIAGRKGTRFTFRLAARPDEFAWSPDEKQFAYVSNSSVYVLDLTSDKAKSKLIIRGASYVTWVK